MLTLIGVGTLTAFLPANGPELSCGGEQPPQRNPVRASQVLFDSNWLFRASKIVDGWFRQLERLVRPQRKLTVCITFVIM